MPTIEQLRFDPRARAEGRKRALALPEAHLVKLVTTQREESEKNTSALRSSWSESWRYYQSEVDYSDKEEWQSAVFIPMPWTSVEHAGAKLQVALSESSDYFKVDGVDAGDKLLADRVWNPLLKFAFNKASFTAKFVDAIKVALATGISLYLKFRYPSLPSPLLDNLHLDPETGMVSPVYRMQRQSALTVEMVEPWKIYRDPKSKPREQWSGAYLMHEDFVDWAVLASGGEAHIYKNLATVQQAAGGDRQSQGASSEAARRQMSWSPHEFRKQVLATEWYGDILDENGEMVYPDAMMIVANSQTLIYGPADNPLWAVDPKTFRRKWPFVAFTALGHPLRFEGWGILHAVTPLAVLFSNLFNLFADGLNWKVNQPTELNTALLDDDDDNEHYPGKLWRKLGDGQLLTPADIGQMDASAVLASLQFMQQLWENNAFVTRFVRGEEGYRKQITKGEVQLMTAQNMGIFEAMGKNIEAGGVAALELGHDLLSQYTTSWTDPSLAGLVGQEYAMLLSMLDPVARMRELSGQFNYVFTGITAALQKAELLGRLLQASALAAQGPYLGYTNPSEVLAAIFDALGLRDQITVMQEPAIPISRIGQMLGGIPAGGNGRQLSIPTMKQLEPTPAELSAGAA